MNLTADLKEHFSHSPLPITVLQSTTIDLLAALSFETLRNLLDAAPHRAFGLKPSDEFRKMSLSELFDSALYQEPLSPIAYKQLWLESSRALLVPEGALYLLKHEDAPVAVLFVLQTSAETTTVRIEVAAPTLSEAEAFMAVLNAPSPAASPISLLLKPTRDGGHLAHIAPSFTADGNVEQLLLASSVAQELQLWAERLSIPLPQRKAQLLAFIGPAGSGKADAMRWIAEKANRNLTLYAGNIDLTAMDDLFKIALSRTPSTLVLHFESLDSESPGRITVEYLLQLLELSKHSADLTVLLSSNDTENFRSLCASKPSVITEVFHLKLPDSAARQRMLDAFPALEHRADAVTEALLSSTDGMSRAFVLTFFERLSLYVVSHGVTELTREHILLALKELQEGDKKDRFSILGGREFYESFAFFFDEIQKLSDRALQDLLRHVPRDILVLALKFSSEEVKQRVYSNVSRRAAMMIGEDLDELGNLTKDRSLEAQRQVVAILKEVVDERYYVIDLT